MADKRARDASELDALRTKIAKLEKNAAEQQALRASLDAFTRPSFSAAMITFTSAILRARERGLLPWLISKEQFQSEYSPLQNCRYPTLARLFMTNHDDSKLLMLEIDAYNNWKDAHVRIHDLGETSLWPRVRYDTNAQDGVISIMHAQTGKEQHQWATMEDLKLVKSRGGIKLQVSSRQPKGMSVLPADLQANVVEYLRCPLAIPESTSHIEISDALYMTWKHLLLPQRDKEEWGNRWIDVFDEAMATCK